MALDFDSAGSNRHVNHGSAGTVSIDNLPQGANGMTVWAWVYRTANGSNQHIVTKDNTFPSGWGFLCDNAAGEGEIRFLCFCGATSTNWADAISGTGQITLNTWHFVAGTITDIDAFPSPKLFIGSLSANVAEVGSYSKQQIAGSGYSNDAAANLYVGNLQRSTTLPFRGRIARVGVVNRALSVAEMVRLQRGTIPQANVSGTVLLADYYGTGTQADLSGNLNNGTVTSATAASHVPLVPYGMTSGWTGAFTAAAATFNAGRALNANSIIGVGLHA